MVAYFLVLMICRSILWIELVVSIGAMSGFFELLDLVAEFDHGAQQSIIEIMAERSMLEIKIALQMRDSRFVFDFLDR